MLLPSWPLLIRPHASFGLLRSTRSYGRTRHDPLRSLLIRPHATFGLLRPTRSFGRTRHTAPRGQVAHAATRFSALAVLAHTAACDVRPPTVNSLIRSHASRPLAVLAHTAHATFGLLRPTRSCGRTRHQLPSQVARSPWRYTSAACATRATRRLLHCLVPSAGGSCSLVNLILEERGRPAAGLGTRIRSNVSRDQAERSGARLCICARSKEEA